MILGISTSSEHNFPTSIDSRDYEQNRVWLPDAYAGGRGKFVNIVTEVVATKQEDKGPRGARLPVSTSMQPQCFQV